MISVIFLNLKRPSFGNMYVHRGIINLTCIVVVADSRCVCVGVYVWGWRVARSTLRVVSHRLGWPFCLVGWCHIRVVKSLFKTLHNPFIHKCFGHMQSMVVLHDTRYSRVTLSVAPRGSRPSLWWTAGSEVNLTGKVESFLFVLWWYIVRVEKVGGD